jgi:glycosyltransferase involved in cell wall biosynthesis
LQNKQLKLTIAGEGDESYIAGLKQLCKEKKVSEQFEFTGGVYGERKWELYQESDLFVLPTYSENFGIVVAEALATGIPVITTTGTPWQELETEKCGWWIDLDEQNLANTLSIAMQASEEDLEVMGKNGINLIKNNYSIVNVSQKIKNLYQEICKI